MQLKNIYIIDDDDVFALAFAKQLQKYGTYKVHHYGSAETSLIYGKIDQPEVLFLDINLKGTNGADSIPKWKALNPGIQIIMISSGKDPEMLRHALQYEVTEFINKDIYLLGDAHRLLHELKNENFLTGFIKKFAQKIRS